MQHLRQCYELYWPLQMGELYQKMIRLEALVDDFQNNNEEYLKIIKTVGEECLVLFQM